MYNRLLRLYQKDYPQDRVRVNDNLYTLLYIG